MTILFQDIEGFKEVTKCVICKKTIEARWGRIKCRKCEGVRRR